MKKVKVLLTLIMIFSAMCFLTSCDEETTEPEVHTHTWTDWVVLNKATCTAEGLKGRDCSECPEYERETITKLEHEYEEGIVLAEAGCVVDGVKLLACKHCKDIQSKTMAAIGHSFDNGKCTKCGHQEGEIKNYELTVEVNGGTMTSVDGVYTEGSVVSLPNPTKENYIFEGWYSTESFDVSSKISNIVTINKDMVVYAKWALDGYVISLDATKGNVATDTLILKENQVYTLEIPTTNEYVFFTGWYLGEQQVTDEFGKCLEPWDVLEDTKLTAKWAEEKVINGVKYLYQGEYPQSLVVDESIISELGKITEINERGYMEYDGNQYVKVVYDNPDTTSWFNNGEKLVDGNTYYFRVDPILWRILDEEKGIVISDIILDTMAYYESKIIHEGGVSINPNNYEYSDISSWLNGDVKFTKNNFATKAFEDPLDIIEMTKEIDNSAATTMNKDNQYVCDNFDNFFYLLSYVEYNNLYHKKLDGGKCKASDYAIARTLKIDNYSMTGEWWLRSPSADNKAAVVAVTTIGEVCDNMVDNANIGVRPAVKFKNLVEEGGTTND